MRYKARINQIDKVIQKMKIVCIFLALWCVKLVQSACMAQCAACSNSTACTSCVAGHFVSANRNCQPCPPTCTTCTMSNSGLPFCTACVGTAQLNPNNGKCYFCEPSCSGCTNQPYNCTSCKLGLALQTINNTNFCFTDINCTFANCAACGISNGEQVCQTCMPGYFQLNSDCFPCKFPTVACTFDTNSLWSNQAASFWLNAATWLYPNYPSNPTSLPYYFNNMNFYTMDSLFVSRWSYAYLLYRTFTPYLSPSQNNISAILQDAVSFISSIPSNYNRSQSLNSILTHIILTYSLSTYSISAQDVVTMSGKYANKYISYSTCAVGYYYDAASVELCVSCSSSCLSCTSGTSCTTCSLGYYLRAGQCYKCESNCNNCVETSSNPNANIHSVCVECRLPYVYHSNSMQCILCNSPCRTCAPANPSYCYTCNSPFSLSANYYGLCYRCSQDTCLHCESTLVSTCLQCKAGHTAINGMCYACNANCKQCSILTNWNYRCHQCNPGFTLTTNSNCVECGHGCLQCAEHSSAICITCADGLYLDASTATCLLCAAHCATCSSQIQCSSYKHQMVLHSNITVDCRVGCAKCKPTNPQLCVQCLPRFYYEPSSWTCLPCSSNCLQCASSLQCLQCVDSYSMIANQCYSCSDTNCRLCNATNNTQCLYCNRGYLLSGGVCLSAASACAYNCISCFYANNTNVLVCAQCMQGYALRPNGTCVRCVRNCSGTCDSANVTKCLSCIASYYLSNNQCFACTPGCKTCPHGQCTQCLPSYQLKQTNGVLSCNYICRQPCKACSYTACVSCMPGYLLSSSTCVISPYINTSPSFCPAGTYNTDSSHATHYCVACPAHCSLCSSGTTCSSCVVGYYLYNSSYCAACPSQCYSCYDGNACISCGSGYVKQIVAYLDQDEANPYSSSNKIVYGDNCVSCSANCLTCSITVDRCISCHSNYYLYNERCIYRYTVYYNYTLNYDYYAFIANAQSQSFLAALSSLISINITNIYIDYILPGSTQIGGRVGTTSLVHATSVSNLLTSSGVPGFTILSASATAYLYNTEVLQVSYHNYTTDSPAEATPFNYTPIIVASSIGTFVVLSIIVIALIRCNRHNNQLMKLGESTSSLDASKTAGQSRADISIEDIEPTEKKRLRIRKRRL